MQQLTLFNYKQGKEKKLDMEIEDNNKKNIKNHLLPWVEKYRPNNIDEVSYQEEIITALQGVIKTGSLPNLLLYGPPGTGKTSTILALAKQLYGPTFFKNRILELNASDDRGIQVVREKIKKFAQIIPTKNPNKEYLCPSYKIIILDEADLMTQEAQAALRRIMEDTAQSTRFCIICNYVTKIIEPLASRCIKYRFNSISLEAQIKKLNYICEQESIKANQEAIIKLIDVSQGDLRKSINMLQSASILFKKKISDKDIVEISGIVPDIYIIELYSMIINLNNINEFMQKIDEILYEGYSADQINEQLFNMIINSQDINEIKKARMMEKFALCDKSLNEGAKEDLQLYNLLTSCYQIMKKPDF